MSSHNPEVYLQDIVDSIEHIQNYLEETAEQDFYENVEKQDAVLRRLEIIGEAVKNLPAETRTNYPDVPWRKIAGIRDVIIHAYSGVKISMIWVVTQDDLPELKDRVIQILEVESEKTEKNSGEQE